MMYKISFASLLDNPLDLQILVHLQMAIAGLDKSIYIKGEKLVYSFKLYLIIETSL